jgi:hypothetical protein
VIGGLRHNDHEGYVLGHRWLSTTLAVGNDKVRE